MDDAAATVCVLTEWPLRPGWEEDLLRRTLMREGIRANQVTWKSLLTERPYAGDIRKVPREVLTSRRNDCLTEVRTSGARVVLSMGKAATELLLPGRSDIDKWQASVLFSPDCEKKVIPCYSTERVAKDLSLQLWLSICARKLHAESHTKELKEPKHDFLLNPPLEEALDFLREARSAAHLSVDIETGRGQINTVGFAVSPQRAIAINVLPDRLSAESNYRLWSSIRETLESDQPKILQNFIYEYLFFSRYGIQLRGVAHDTMICQKFLWPEFEMGLDSVGRMYSEMPYWKDDGKSWNNIRDWDAHYRYNCKDTCGTFEGFLGQRKDLLERGTLKLHDDYLRRLFPAVAEMCSWGFPVSEQRLRDLRTTVGREYGDALLALRELPGASGLNPRSPAQVKGFLTAAPRKYSIPKKYDAKEKKHKESTDEKSLKKLRMKYPKDEALPLLLRIAKLGKAQSAYLSFGYDHDKRMRFMLNAHGTETGRFSGSKDPWGGGVNPQTIPGGNKGINIKSCFEAETGFLLLEVDLRQAETRYVAYRSADPNLIRMVEDPKQDIHRYVAAEIFGIPESAVTKQQRQLGKKSGHGANYSIKEATFMDACISEMDLVLSKSEANRVLESYHKLFPGIRRYHTDIRRELQQTRTLRTPLGRVRQFWGRLDDDMFREAYAYEPQSTIPDILNHLMLHLIESRRLGSLSFRLLLQCHDSLLLEVPESFVPAVAQECLKTQNWHPQMINLPGGRLIIPTEVKVGRNWGNLTEWRDSHNEDTNNEAADKEETGKEESRRIAYEVTG